MKFVILFGMSFNPSFKMVSCFTNLMGAAGSTSKLVRKDFKDITGKILNCQENALHMKNNFHF